MQQPTRLISTPFAQEGEKTEIQNATGEFDNSATYRLGFPPLTMQSIRLGGKPPKGTDFNGILFDITENISFLCKGGRYQYNAGLSTLIGGYPEGSNLLLDDNVTEVVSTVAGNQNNPNTDMTGWVLKPNRTTAEYVLDASGETQQQVNYNGGSKWHSRDGGYLENERVVLANGDIVKSTVDGNTNDPNVDMTGWVKENSASQIIDESGLSQQVINKTKIPFFDNFDDLPANATDGEVAYVKSTNSFFYKGIDDWIPSDKYIINLKDYPRLAPEVSDDGRFIRALSDTDTFPTTTSMSGYPIAPVTVVEIPPSEYTLVDQVTIASPFVEIKGIGKPTIKNIGNTKDLFVFNGAYVNKVSNITFQGGKSHLAITNPNTDATRISVNDCEFHYSDSFAINTFGTSPWSHLSALVEINSCAFIKCKKAINNVADKMTVNQCWLYPTYENFTADTAYIVNRGIELNMNHCLGVPVMGGTSWGDGSIPRVSGARWIDNYGGLTLSQSRFGLESDGMVIVDSYGGLDDFSNNMGSFIHIKDCTTAGGVEFNLNDNTQIGIVRIKDKIPRQIYITDNILQLACPAIVVENEVNLFNYITSQPDFKRLIDIKVHSNQSWQSNGTLPNYPSVLSPYVNKGLSDVDLMTLRPHVFSQNTNATSNAWFSYPIPIGVNNFTMLLTVRGNPHSSTAGSLQQQSSTYVLKLETFKNGTGQTVRYITSQLLLPYVEPEGVAKNDYRPEVKTWFGESFYENPSVEIISASKTTADFFTVRVFSVWNAVITLVPLDMGADGYWKQGIN